MRKGHDLGLAADLAGLVLFIVLCLGIGALGGAVTDSSVTDWYPTFVKPSFNPPDAIFGPIWTVLCSIPLALAVIVTLDVIVAAHIPPYR